MRIYIKGLKSLGGENYIALGKKLTFLVGPNSAGKSVLLMALDNLKGAWIDRKFEIDLVHTNPNRGDFLEGVQSLGVEWQHKKNKFILVDSHCLLSKKDLRDRNIKIQDIHRNSIDYKKEYEEEFDQAVIEYKHYYKNNNFILLKKRISKEPSDYHLFKLFRRGTANDPFLEGVFNLAALDPSSESALTQINKWILEVILNRLQIIKNHLSSTTSERARIKLEEDLNFLQQLYDDQKNHHEEGLFIWWPAAIFDCAIELEGVAKQKFTNIFTKNAAIVKKIERGLVIGFEQSYPGPGFECATVSANRSLPIRENLSAIVDMHSTDDMFHEIMTSEIESSWMNRNGGNNERLISEVNRALRDDLFFDNGYQLKVKVHAMVTHEEWERDEIEKMEEGRMFWCEISLRDSHGRKLGFEDVGSGIGYVLPVLIEIFRPKNNGKTVFLQQPELHLHPAMQANLTDVLIRAASGKRIIAETHSEHLILRALKRIRQTSSKTIKDPELKLYPEDVAVNYFEPLGDGTTRVHILRVSSDGDFIDRWPNGFFAERDGELFDE